MPERDKVQQSITTPVSLDSESGMGPFTDTTPPPLTTLPNFAPDASGLTKTDLILVQQAITKGWPLDETTKAQTIAAAHWILTNKAKSPRDRLRAAEFLLAVDKHQLEIVKAFLPQQPTTAVQVNVSTTGQRDLSALSDAELEARLQALETTKPGG